MGKYEKLLERILDGRADANVRSDELCNLLLQHGFVMRTSGSHHIFRKSGVEEKVNIQREGNMAKPYQVRQVRRLIQKYRLGGRG